MKKTILGILIFTNIVYATDYTREFLTKLSNNNSSDKFFKNYFLCQRDHMHDFNKGITTHCQEAIKFYTKESGPAMYLTEMYIRGGQLYYQKGNLVKAYEYFKTGAYIDDGEINSISCQQALNILCKESPWVCKK